MSDHRDGYEREPFVDAPPDDYDPTAVVMAGLAAASRGEPYDEDAMSEACQVLACLALLSRGLDYETATRAVDQAVDKGDIRVKWSEADGLEVTIGEGIVAPHNEQEPTA